jgi:choline/glycine/proline betaine transport protein
VLLKLTLVYIIYLVLSKAPYSSFTHYFCEYFSSLSVFLGLDKGVKRLSELNLVLALILLVFVFIAGPSIYLLQTTIQNTGQYISNLFTMTFNLYAYQPNGWIGGWTILYWACVDFMVTICGYVYRKGFTWTYYREFIVGVLLIPTGFTIIWMGFLGNAALFSIIQEHQTTLIQAVQQDSSVALFDFLGHLPLVWCHEC